MAAIITNDDIRAFNVSNKFGFLNISDSEDEDSAWKKPKKPAKQPSTAASKKKPSKPSSNVSNTSVIGMSAAPPQNIITPQLGQAQGLSKNAKRRARKKKQAAAEATATAEEAEPSAPSAPPLTEEEQFQEQLDSAMRLSKLEEAQREQRAIDEMVTTERNAESPQKPTMKKRNKAHSEAGNEPEETGEEEEEEEDLFLPVIDDIKDVIRRISKEDEVPITEIPIDNNQLLRKRALELQEINCEFKQKLNSLLRVGYKYKRKYQKEKESTKMLSKVLGRCESSKKPEMVKTILRHEETEQILTKQIEELLEDLERERSKSHGQQGDKKSTTVKKVSFSSD